MLVDHERHYGLGMDALVTMCSWTTNVIMVWEWMHWSPCARGPRTLLWFSAWMHWSPCARGPQASLWFGHGCTGHCVLVDQKRHYGLGMDALVAVCSWTTNVIMVWAWMHWSPCALDQKRHYGLGMDALVTVCSWTRNVIMVWAWMHWSPCARGPRMSFCLGMDALVTVCSWTRNVIMVWAWMHWSPCARGPRTLLWFSAWMHWSPPAKVLACVGLQVVLRGEFRTAKFSQDSHD